MTVVDISVNVEMPVVPAPEVELEFKLVEEVGEAVSVGVLPIGVGVSVFDSRSLAQVCVTT